MKLKNVVPNNIQLVEINSISICFIFLFCFFIILIHISIFAIYNLKKELTSFYSYLSIVNEYKDYSPPSYTDKKHYKNMSLDIKDMIDRKEYYAAYIYILKNNILNIFKKLNTAIYNKSF